MVATHFCPLREKVVSPHPLNQFGHGGRGLPNALADISVKAQVKGEVRLTSIKTIDYFICPPI